MQQSSTSPGILKVIRNYFFGTWDRSLTSFSTLLSLISLILTIVVWQFPENLPRLIVARDLLIVAGFILILTVLAGRNVRREGLIQSLRSYSASQLKHSHNIAHNYRDTIFDHFQLPDNLDIEVTEQELDVFRRICGFVTDELRHCFIEYFRSIGIDIGEDISITVKLIIPSSKIIDFIKQLDPYQKQQVQRKNQWVITIFRDHQTFINHRNEREVGGQKIYDITNNSAFHHIYENLQPYFLSNNLKAMGQNYVNENTKWQEQYNATLVVPIRYQNSSPSKHICYGFLSVDSLNPNGLELYNAQECRYILSHAADLLATFFLSLALYKYKPAS